jgi:hypothetical protein
MSPVNLTEVDVLKLLIFDASFKFWVLKEISIVYSSILLLKLYNNDADSDHCILYCIPNLSKTQTDLHRTSFYSSLIKINMYLTFCLNVQSIGNLKFLSPI